MAIAQNGKLFLAVGLLLVAGVIVVLRGGSEVGPRITGALYYDVDAGKLFVGPTDALAPIPAPSGGDGVRAFVFACGQCDDPLNGDIAYLAKYSDEAKKQILSLREQAASAGPEEQTMLYAEADSNLTLKRLVAPPDAGRWLPDDGSTVDPLRQALVAKCGSEKLVPCRVMQ